jgi:hypothetical protein
MLKQWKLGTSELMEHNTKSRTPFIENFKKENYNNQTA